MGPVAMLCPSPLPRLSRTVGPSIPFPSWLGQRGIAPSRACPRDELWRQVELFDGVASPHVVTPPRRLLNIAPRRRSASLEAVLRHPSRLGDNATFQALVGAGYYDRTGGRPADVGTVAILWVDGPYKFDASLDRLGNSAVLLIVRFENIAEHPFS